MSDPENEEIELEDSESGLSSNSKNEAEEDGEKSEDNESDEPQENDQVGNSRHPI